MTGSSEQTESFNLVDEPWIKCRTITGEVVELSLRDTLARAGTLRELAGELPTQDVAVFRLLLAVLLSSVRPTRTRTDQEAEDLWLNWWEAGSFPEVVFSYLNRIHPRLDLLDPIAPIFQVAGLTTGSGKTTGLAKLIGDVPANAQFFTTRAGTSLEQLPLAEAARWLAHCQAFDPAGIKTGASGDDRVKGGRGYSMFYPAWTGNIGVVVLHGRNLFETLMLNLPLQSSGPDDLPVWERPALGAAVDQTHTDPLGPADVFTWPSRRLRLFVTDGRAVDSQISNGDRLEPNDRFNVEPMCAWRKNQTQSKQGDLVRSPVRHDPSRRIWQGLGPLLAESEADGSKVPAAVTWLAELLEARALPADTLLTVQTVGMEYGTQNSVISGAVDDRLMTSAAALTDPTLTQLAIAAADQARSAVIALANLASNLDRSAGGEGQDNVREPAFELGYSSLDRPYRRWLRRLGPDTDHYTAQQLWTDEATSVLARAADQLTRDAGPAAWAGREVSTGATTSQWLDAGLANLWFRSALHKAFPHLEPTEEVSA